MFRFHWNHHRALLQKYIDPLHKHWLSNIALEAEAAITRLPTDEQEHVRFQVAHNLQKLYKQHNGKKKQV